jgi:hypothetical protein
MPRLASVSLALPLLEQLQLSACLQLESVTLVTPRLAFLDLRYMLAGRTHARSRRPRISRPVCSMCCTLTALDARVPMALATCNLFKCRSLNLPRYASPPCTWPSEARGWCCIVLPRFSCSINHALYACHALICVSVSVIDLFCMCHHDSFDALVMAVSAALTTINCGGFAHLFYYGPIMLTHAYGERGIMLYLTRSRKRVSCGKLRLELACSEFVRALDVVTVASAQCG